MPFPARGGDSGAPYQMNETSDPAEQIREALLQSFGNFLDVHQRYIPDASFDAAVVGSMKPAALGSLLLVDALCLAYATDCTAKTNTNVERHRPDVRLRIANKYTLDESHCSTIYAF